ncbi:MAG: hypothetical protein B7C24_02175 [Bacteroidetes bacterium 4572_77]|nr:MAG: hypothetical protein B7C24_02175 [Bacteroidetes bacterium 4572_77]
MKIKLIVAISLVLLFSYACEKSYDCDKDTGYLEIYNSTDYKYSFYIDSVYYKTLNKFEKANYELPVKHYYIKFVQVSGIDSIPYIYNTSVDVDACSYSSCNILVYP